MVHIACQIPRERANTLYKSMPPCKKYMLQNVPLQTLETLDAYRLLSFWMSNWLQELKGLLEKLGEELSEEELDQASLQSDRNTGRSRHIKNNRC